MKRTVAGAALLVLAYVCALYALAAATDTRGLITPERAPDLWLLGLGALVLALRVTAVFLVPALLGHRLLAEVLARRARRPAP